MRFYRDSGRESGSYYLGFIRVVSKIRVPLWYPQILGAAI